MNIWEEKVEFESAKIPRLGISGVLKTALPLNVIYLIMDNI